MAKAVITLDEQQVIKLEQVIIDHDENGAWEVLAEIRAKVKATQDTRCGIEKLRKQSVKKYGGQGKQPINEVAGAWDETHTEDS